MQQWVVDQYNRAKSNGWIPHFQVAAGKHGFTVEDLMGIASRETNMKNIVGDHGHGYGIMQVDIGTDPAFCKTDWTFPEKSILRGTEILAGKRDQIVRASKQSKASIKFRSGKVASFTPKPFNDEQLRQMTLAAYNCGIAAYYHFSLGHDIDAGTTGKDYSSDVLQRSDDFHTCIVGDHTQTPAPVETPKTDSKSGIPTPAPAPQTQPIDFDKWQDKYNDHADLVKNKTVKGSVAKATAKIGGGIGSLWEMGFTGRVLLILGGAIVVGVIGYEIYNYRVGIGNTIKGFWKWALSK